MMNYWGKQQRGLCRVKERTQHVTVQGIRAVVAVGDQEQPTAIHDWAGLIRHWLAWWLTQVTATHHQAILAQLTSYMHVCRLL
jgi:hypothetical protein